MIFSNRNPLESQLFPIKKIINTLIINNLYFILICFDLEVIDYRKRLPRSFLVNRKNL